MRKTAEYLYHQSGIYCAIHRDSGMCYVGSTINLGVRFTSHIRTAVRGSTTPFHRALREFGFDAFDFEVLERCDRSVLLEREQFYIALLGSATLGGFNAREKAHATYGVIPDGVTRQRQSIAKIGRKLTEEHKQKLRIVKRRKKGPLSAEHKARLSESHKNSAAGKAHRDAMHAAQRGKKQTPEHIAKKSAALIGTKRTEEQRKRIGDSQRGKLRSEEAKANMKLGWIKWRERKAISEGELPVVRRADTATA